MAAAVLTVHVPFGHSQSTGLSRKVLDRAWVRESWGDVTTLGVSSDGIAVDLLFAATPFTGLEHQALHTLRGLREVGTSVDVWVGKNLLRELGDAVHGHQPVLFPAAPRPLRLGWEQWAVPWRFGAHPKSYRLLHSMSGVAPLLTRLPLVLTVPDLTYRIAPGDLHPKARLYFGTLVPRSIRRARRILVLSDAIRRQVIELYHISTERVVTVPLCADAIFRPQPAESILSTRRRFGLPERYILYVGTIEPRKDLLRLRAAYDRLPPDLSDVPLVLVGRTAFGAEALAKELRRSSGYGYVLTPGYLPREALPAIYSGAAVFVYPSRYEGFGLPVLEAMACGAPVVVSNCEALTELVQGAGIVLTGPSVEELTQALEGMLRFDDERRRYQELALARAAGYTSRHLGLRTAAAYAEALDA